MSELVVRGKRISYIFGGVFCVLAALVSGALFLPDLFYELFDVELWDLKSAISDDLNDSIIKSLSVWGLRVGLIVLFVVYDISTCFRQSANSTFLRLSAILGVLAFLLPTLLEMLSDLTETSDLLQYENGIRLVCFVGALGCLITGIILRIIQKYHPDRSSTLLVFNAVFWTVCAFFVAYDALTDILGLENVLAIFSNVLLDNKAMLGLLSIFLLVCGNWMLFTIPHRVWKEESNSEPKEERPAPNLSRSAISRPGSQGKVRTLADVGEETKNADKYTSKKRSVSSPYINSDNFTPIPVERPRSQQVTRKSGVDVVNSTSRTAKRPNDSGVDGPGFRGGNSGKKTVVEDSVPDTQPDSTTPSENPDSATNQ